MKHIILHKLEITETEYDIIEMSGYIFNIDINRQFNTLSDIRILLESSINRSSPTFTNHGNSSVDVTDSVLSMIKHFRNQSRN